MLIDIIVWLILPRMFLNVSFPKAKGSDSLHQALLKGLRAVSLARLQSQNYIKNRTKEKLTAFSWHPNFGLVSTYASSRSMFNLWVRNGSFRCIFSMTDQRTAWLSCQLINLECDMKHFNTKNMSGMGLTLEINMRRK